MVTLTPRRDSTLSRIIGWKIIFTMCTLAWLVIILLILDAAGVI